MTLRTFFATHARAVSSNINHYLFQEWNAGTDYLTLYERAEKAGITSSKQSFRRHYDLWKSNRVVPNDAVNIASTQQAEATA